MARRMPRETVSFAASLTFRPPHPERTTRQLAANGWDVTFTTWPARGPMARAIRMQQKRAPNNYDLRAVVPLSDIEGY